MDHDNLVRPKKPLEPTGDGTVLCGGSVQKDYLILKRTISELGFNMPPLLNSYNNLASSMKYFGSAECYDLIGSVEVGIMINFDDIHPDKKERHLK